MKMLMRCNESVQEWRWMRWKLATIILKGGVIFRNMHLNMYGNTYSKVMMESLTFVGSKDSLFLQEERQKYNYRFIE